MANQDKLFVDQVRDEAIHSAAYHAEDFKSKIVIIIPALDEAESLPYVLRSIPKMILGNNTSVIVVDDGSSDNTSAVASKNNAICLRHSTNLGQGAAIRTAIKLVLPLEPKIIVTFDADGQHDANDLERLVKPVLEKQCEMTIGSRFLGVQEVVNKERTIGIKFFTWMVNFLCNSNISDLTNGLRAIDYSILSKITLTEEKYSAPEILMEALMKGFRVMNVPMQAHPRKAGSTKKPRLAFALGLLRVILTTWTRNKLKSN